MLVGITALVAAAGAAGLAWLYPEEEEGEAQYIFVAGDVEAEEDELQGELRAPAPAGSGASQDPPAAEAGADAGGATPPDAAPRMREREPERRGGARSQQERLTRAFRRQQPAVRRCFDEHAQEAIGSPELSVRFRVGTEGEIISAELVPEAAMDTPLGACLVEVAKRTDFGPQKEALRFRIPIAVRAR